MNEGWGTIKLFFNLFKIGLERSSYLNNIPEFLNSNKFLFNLMLVIK